MNFRAWHDLNTYSQRAARSLVLLCTSICLAQISSAQAELLNKTEVESKRFDTYVSMYNELSKRRQSVIYDDYRVSHRYGVMNNFVHTSNGSVAFSRTELVVDANMPIVLRRVYHSDRENSNVLGASGWAFANLEQIRTEESGRLLYEYGNGTIVELDSEGGFINRDDMFFTDLLRVELKDQHAIVIHTRDGLAKTFMNDGERFLLESVCDSFENCHVYYYETGRIKRIESNDGAFLDFFFGSENQVDRVVDDSGRELRYGYDEYGRLDWAADGRKQIWTYSYDESSSLSKSKAPNGNFDLVFEYDDSGRANLASINGIQKTFGYNRARTTVTDASGRSAVFVASQHGTLRAIENGLGVKSELILNKEGVPRGLKRDGVVIARLQERRRNGQILVLRGRDSSYRVMFDEIGRVNARLSKSDSIPQYKVRYLGQTMLPTEVRGDSVQKNIGFGPAGHLLSYGDKSKNSISFQFLNEGEVLVTDGTVSASLFFGESGNLEMVKRDESVALYSYDEFGFRRQTRTASGVLVDYNYDAVGNMIATEVSIGGRDAEHFTYVVDASNRLEFILGADGEAQATFEYNEVGLPTAALTDKFIDLEFDYDAIGRLFSIQPEGGPTLYYEYEESEIDIAQQYDAKTSFVRSMRREETSFLTRFEQRLARTRPVDLGVFYFSDSADEIKVIGDSSDWMPSKWISDAVTNSSVMALLTPEGVDFEAFSKPSNRYFIPQEMESVNCCFCCPTPQQPEFCALN